MHTTPPLSTHSSPLPLSAHSPPSPFFEEYSSVMGNKGPPVPVPVPVLPSPPFPFFLPFFLLLSPVSCSLQARARGERKEEGEGRARDYRQGAAKVPGSLQKGTQRERATAVFCSIKEPTEALMGRGGATEEEELTAKTKTSLN